VNTRALAACVGLLSLGCAPLVDDGSRCVTTEHHISCTYKVDDVWTGLGDVHPRRVFYEVPIGTPPDDGWPVVVFFSGSGIRAKWTFSGRTVEPFGSYHQAELVRDLLDEGYAVIAPETKFRGFSYWDSNVLGLSAFWDLAEDGVFFESVLDEIARDRFGALDEENLFATGISSGGYMTSRVAITHPDRVRAVAIASASYAWCWGPVCEPGEIESDHPPTLFVHGGADVVVPVSTMERYADALDEAGIEHRVVVDETVGHGWIPAAPLEVRAFFDAHQGGDGIVVD